MSGGLLIGGAVQSLGGGDPTILPASVSPVSLAALQSAGWREWDMNLSGDAATAFR